jgi:hypothetical protein
MTPVLQQRFEIRRILASQELGSTVGGLAGGLVVVRFALSAVR